ncbi:CPBP family intramembrane glutamic endopeptidase [Halohasta litorea]|uniref:CPBP family intramembrane glutamic endopeptidase n=1 Tax=Halohasta litorea TaxID=869891 RepID=A0ABD6D8Q3_9EURY|nr:CPBP family intramembrane glutamic endopeptidase [Halohasta litorea]
MAQWTTFAGFLGVILVLLLALTHASNSVFEDAPGSSIDSADVANDDVALSADGSIHTVGESAVEDEKADTSTSATGPELSTPALLANVAVSQGLFAVLLVTLAWYTEIPAWAFGLAPESFTLGGVATGIAVGSVFYICNEAAAAVGRQWGVSTPSGLREALAPETAAGWAVLLVVVLPIIAGFEELLFRGALIGVLQAGFAVPVWLLVVGSSVAFALGHGAQGRLGIVVTGLLGVGLAAVFVHTGSLVVVIVAHYVINVLEFVVHEGIGPTWLSQ